MKENCTQKEILLFTNNSFAQRHFFNKEQHTGNINAQQQIEEYCANGLIGELLPEVFEIPENTKLYLWQMHAGISFLQLEFGEFPLIIDKLFSIDPHNSLARVNYN